MIDLGLVVRLIGFMILVPWGLLVVWWYVALVYYVFFHREAAHNTDDFGIKILTTGDDSEVLEKTVSYCEREPLVISRKPVSISRGDLKVLPEGFECAAQFKGEQLEWARRELPQPYTLYLDEDSLCNFSEIPAADLVQFQEVPHSKKVLIASIEAHRIGFQIEQAFFEKTGPLYLWGGGFAVSNKLEQVTTWDRPSITEDTAFVFSLKQPYSFKFSKKKIDAQAPLTIKDLIRQRWRWASGTFDDLKYLDGHPWRRAWVNFRQLNWGLWPIYSLIPFVLGLPLWISILPLLQSGVWTALGAKIIGLSWQRTVIAVVLTPVTAYVHSIGCTLALLERQFMFARTPKSSDTTSRRMPSDDEPDQAVSTRRNRAAA